MTALYLDCFSGIAGDMLVGALLDVGASFDRVRTAVESLGVDGFALSARQVRRGALAATKFDVDAEEGHVHRGLSDVRALIEAATLPPRAAARALRAFEVLAEAEGRVHGQPKETVHFHEVGAIDALCDVVGACVALEDLGVDRVFVSPLRVGSGFVQCAHGAMPVPAPGALGCLTGFDVRFEEGRGELVTPTGAALLAAVAEPRVPPAFVVERVGYGAGTRDPEDVPNVLRAVLGRLPQPADTVLELSTNVDHVPPTVLGVVTDRLLAAGALDAFVSPCTMKKGRPGHLIVALAPEHARAAVEQVLFTETGTLGVRRRAVERTVLERRHVSVDTPWGPVRIKLGTFEGAVTSAVPEFEDCRALAESGGVPVAEVIDSARAAHREARARIPTNE